MGFWNLSDGKELGTAKEFDSNEAIKPIPHGSVVVAAMDECAWDDYQGLRFIKARWTVLDGEYKNRKIFQKIKVCESDSKKRDKAMKMLGAIDANAGGQLRSVPGEPTDQDLQRCLMNKPMALKLAVWEMKDSTTGEMNTGNWVQKVAPASSEMAEAAANVQPQAAAASAAATEDDADDWD